MKNVIGIYNPYGLIQKAGKKRLTRKRKNRSRRSKKTRRH